MQRYPIDTEADKRTYGVITFRESTGPCNGRIILSSSSSRCVRSQRACFIQSNGIDLFSWAIKSKLPTLGDGFCFSAHTYICTWLCWTQNNISLPELLSKPSSSSSTGSTLPSTYTTCLSKPLKSPPSSSWDSLLKSLS